MSRKSVAGRPRRGLLVFGVVAVSALVFAFFTNRWFVNPQVTENLQPADAVVVFPGGKLEEARFERAIQLMNHGIAPVLFVATDVKQGQLEASVCDGSAYEFQTSCRLSDPRTTFGNARVTGIEAEAQGWTSVILVTADDHITRSRMLLGRCFDGEIQTAVSEVDPDERRRLYRTAYEWAAMGKAIFTDRC